MDEQMIPFWGHAATRQFVRGKPNPCGLKNFVVCSSDGLPLDFFLYEGKGDSIFPIEQLNYPKLDIGGKVIVRLTQNLPQGISIFMDRYFTSTDLLDELHIRGFQGTGTLKKIEYLLVHRCILIQNFVEEGEDTLVKQSGRMIKFAL